MAESWQSAWVEVLPDFSDFKRRVDTVLTPTLSSAGSAGASAFSRSFVGQVFSANFLANLATRAIDTITFAIGNGIRAGVEFGFEGVQLASGLGEQVNAVKVQFGDLSDEILELSHKAPQSLNLTQTAFNKLAVRFASFAKTVAGPGGKASDIIAELTQRGADFASVYDIEVDEALALFQSGLAGETEPLRRFGLDLSAASVQAYAYANGIAAQGAELTEAQKIQARYGSLLDQTKSVYGDLANTSGSLANVQRALAVGFEEAQTKLGGFLLPAFTAAAVYIKENLTPRISELIDNVGPKFATALENSAPKVEALLDKLVPLAENFATMVAEDGIPAFIDTMDEIVTNAPEWLAALDTLANPRSDFNQWFDEFLNGPANFHDDVLVPFFETPVDLPWSGLLGPLNLKDGGQEAADEIAGGFAAGMQTADGWDQGATAVDGHVTQILASLNFGPFMTQAGAAGAQGLADGLASGQIKVGIAAAGLASVAVAKIKAGLKISSPSKVMAELGGFAADGFVQGWNATPIDMSLPSVRLPGASAFAASGAAAGMTVVLQSKGGIDLTQYIEARIVQNDMNTAIDVNAGGVA